jgi:molecular chaperone DnaK
MIYKIDQRVFEDITSDLRERITASCRALIADIKREDPNFTVSDFHEVWLVGGMTRCPSVRQTVTDFFKKAPKKDGVPEQVVALGAAMKAAILEGRRPDVTVANVTNHAFGIETVNNVPAILIPRNKSYPFEEKFMLSNPDADQTELSVRWLIADRPKATDCEALAALHFDIEPCAEESARIPLVVSMDESGHLRVKVGEASLIA